MNEKKLLIADTAFVREEIKKNNNFVNVFPMRENDGAYRANLEELLERSKIQAIYFDEVMPKLIPIFEQYIPAAGKNASYLLRVALVKTTFLYVDRCIRVLHRLNQFPEPNLSFVNVESTPLLQWQSEYIQSWRMNQEVIQRIMQALGYEGMNIFEPQDYPEFPKSYTQRNLLFRPNNSGLKEYWAKLSWKYYYHLDNISNPLARIQSLGFGADRFYLGKRGLMGPFGLFQTSLKIEFEKVQKNQALRNKISNEIKFVLETSFQSLMKKLIEEKNFNVLEKLSNEYVQIFMDWFPAGFLEGLDANILKVEQHLNLKVKAVMGHDTTSDQGYLISTAARKHGMSVIGVQHGGHYGYIEDLSIFGQLEYPFYDKMITWGWNKIDSHFSQCETVPLPCPKFSETPLKSNYLKVLGKKPQKDILFYSNQFHRFPHTTTCGATRVDFIDEITSSQESLIKTLSKSFTVEHKPYNMSYVDLYPEHFEKLERAGGENYHLIQSKHKGLSPDFIKTCKLLLWDQVGSGTLECFTSGVPTMVFWQRIYSRESLFAHQLIEELERVGVIHNDPDRLAQEIRKYLTDPKAWMNDADRKKAILAFCQKFALTDPKWYKSWKKYLRNVKNL